MGLFSKLLGDAGAELEKALDEAGKALGEAAKKAGITENDIKKAVESAKAEKASAPAQAAKAAEKSADEDLGPSGFSWGPTMPDEPNQYNFDGTYKQYFEGIFKSEFGSFKITREKGYGGNTTVYRFYEGDKQALVVELMPSKSSSRALRENCRKQGIPYRRFYIDYEGWWNTRTYVITRMNEALGR